jgi:hypothetical protein
MTSSTLLTAVALCFVFGPAVVKTSPPLQRERRCSACDQSVTFRSAGRFVPGRDGRTTRWPRDGWHVDVAVSLAARALTRLGWRS